MKLQLIRYNSSYFTDKSQYQDVTSESLDLLMSTSSVFSGKFIFDEFSISIRYDKYEEETQMWYYENLIGSILASPNYTSLDYYNLKQTLPLKTFKIRKL